MFIKNNSFDTFTLPVNQEFSGFTKDFLYVFATLRLAFKNFIQNQIYIS